jgi:hypothetical protein
MLSRPSLEVTSSLFEAAVDLRLPASGTQRWHIRQDARVGPEHLLPENVRDNQKKTP